MDPADVSAPKMAALRRQHALNPRSQTVRDPAFTAGNPFFDAHDLVQVRYEMLRRVRQDGEHVSEASAAFGLSRPSFYEAQASFAESGLPGLVPQRPGPRRAHKLSDPVIDAVEAARAEQPTLSSGALAELIQQRFGLSVHPRSVERALERRRKRGPQSPA